MRVLARTAACSRAVLLGLLSIGCSKSNTINQFGLGDADATMPDGSADDSWACLANGSPLEPDPTRTMAVTIRLVEATSAQAVVEAVVDACDALDVSCVSANPAFPKGLSPDADGFVNAIVPEGFEGFLRIEGSGFVSSRLFLGPLGVPPSPAFTVQLVRPSELAVMSSLVASSLDPSRGTAIFSVKDCSGARAAGIRFALPTADAASHEFFLINQAPVAPPAAKATDGDGLGGYFNVPPGQTVVRALRGPDDAFAGEAAFHVLPETLAYVDLDPTLR